MDFTDFTEKRNKNKNNNNNNNNNYYYYYCFYYDCCYIYLIRLFREIRCIQPKSRVSSLIPSLKFLFPLSPRNPYYPLLWNATLVSVNVNYIFIPVEGFSGFGGFS